MSLTSKEKLPHCHDGLVAFAKESLNYAHNKQNETGGFDPGNQPLSPSQGTTRMFALTPPSSGGRGLIPRKGERRAAGGEPDDKGQPAKWSAGKTPEKEARDSGQSRSPLRGAGGDILKASRKRMGQKFKNKRRKGQVKEAHPSSHLLPASDYFILTFSFLFDD